MIKRLILLISITTILMGCSATYEAYDISKAKPGATVNGIPYRVMGTYKMHLYVYNEIEKKYVHTIREVRIPGPDNVVAGGYNSKLFSSDKFVFMTNDAGDLIEVSLTSESSAEKNFKALSEQGIAFDAALKAREDAKKAKKKAKNEEETTAVLIAFADAKIAEEAYNTAKVDGKGIAQAYKNWLLAQIKANEACDDFPDNDFCDPNPPFEIDPEELKNILN